MRFELTTLTLARLCSTPELRPLASGPGDRALVIPQAAPICNLYRKGLKIPALDAPAILSLAGNTFDKRKKGAFQRGFMLLGA